MSKLIKEIRAIVGNERASDHPDQLAVVSRDESTLPPVVPEALVWPETPEEISSIVKLCVKTKTPITTRGAGSALEGSTIPATGGLVLDLSRMTTVLEFWPEDLQVRVEPGLIYDNLNAHLKREGLFFPPSPGGSGDIATIGGMASTNASGIYSVKYGGTKEYLLSLDIVTGTGEIMTLGNRAIKRSSGYNLVDLICASEGTLAIISSLTIRLAGLPEHKLQCAFCFEEEVSAARAVSEMRKYGVDLAAVEFLDRRVMQALNKLKEYDLPESPALFLEFHGPQSSNESNRDMAETICSEFHGEALTLRDNQNPWEIRHFVTDAIKYRRPGYSIVRNDVAFPISRLPEMVGFCYELGDSEDIFIHTFGHVGLGLLHALMLARNDDKSEWNRAIDLNNRIIRKTIELGGTVSGEHGIGLAHRDLFELEHGRSVSLMRAIKQQFDPHNILNPGKIFV